VSVDASLTPRRYASDYYYVDNAGQLSIIPRPMWTMLAGVKYQF